MPLICYTAKKFDPATKAVIAQANAILDDYAAQGYDLTLRQLYYQFVAKGLIPNKYTEYKRLGSIVKDARLAGEIDWDRITDRTRNLKQNAHWANPQDIVKACGDQFQVDKWAPQPNYVEVWVEKDALVGLLEVACRPLDVAYFSCRGYTSQSEVWVASQRLLAKIQAGKRVTIIHLGDHDPSGIDMTRDIMDRLTNFLTHHGLRDMVRAYPRRDDEEPLDYEARVRPIIEGSWQCTNPVEVHRIALNMDQVEQYAPPPNPAKLTDSRARGYIDNYGDESWELDALDPTTITDLIRLHVGQLRDDYLWNDAVAREQKGRRELSAVAGGWDKAVKATRM
jgi:hypothetical protein